MSNDPTRLANPKKAIARQPESFSPRQHRESEAFGAGPREIEGKGPDQ